jgi:hypothetical protein
LRTVSLVCLRWCALALRVRACLRVPHVASRVSSLCVDKPPFWRSTLTRRRPSSATSPFSSMCLMCRARTGRCVLWFFSVVACVRPVLVGQLPISFSLSVCTILRLRVRSRTASPHICSFVSAHVLYTSACVYAHLCAHTDRRGLLPSHHRSDAGLLSFGQGVLSHSQGGFAHRGASQHGRFHE